MNDIANARLANSESYTKPLHKACGTLQIKQGQRLSSGPLYDQPREHSMLVFRANHLHRLCVPDPTKPFEPGASLPLMDVHLGITKYFVDHRLMCHHVRPRRLDVKKIIHIRQEVCQPNCPETPHEYCQNTLPTPLTWGPSERS